MGKVAIYIDEAVWKSFKEEVLRKYGTIRGVSKEIESLVESYLVRDALIKCLNNLSETYGFIASGKVKEDRPESKISAGEVLREMRDERAGLS
jgi:tRNA nucleotidyltransferase/poly(A) polymerase